MEVCFKYEHVLQMSKGFFESHPKNVIPTKHTGLHVVVVAMEMVAHGTIHFFALLFSESVSLFFWM